MERLIREQARNGIEGVPNVMLEGKRRDFTFEGANQIHEYAKVLEQLMKESA